MERERRVGRGRLLLWKLQLRPELGWRRRGRRDRCAGGCGRTFRGQYAHLLCAAADLSAWVRHAASILNVKPTRPVIASMMADLQIRVWVRNDQRIAP